MITASGSFEGRSLPAAMRCAAISRSEEHTSELQSQSNLVCRLLLEKQRIVGSETEQQRIAANSAHPAGERFCPRLLLRVRPANQNRGEPALLQMTGGFLHDEAPQAI